MSGQCTGWVLRYGPRDRAMRAVLLTIADAANRDGERAHPGMEAMVDGSLYSEGQVRRSIARLIDGGWIEQTDKPGPGKAAEFRVVMDRSEPEPTPRTTRAVARPTPRERRADGARLDARRSEAETSCSDYGNGLNDAPPAAQLSLSGLPDVPRETSVRPFKEEAHRLTVLAFEQRVKPALRSGRDGAFVAAMGIIEQLLDADNPPESIEAAIRRGVRVWTVAGLQTEIARAEPRTNGADPLRRGGPSLSGQLAEARRLEAAAANHRKGA